MTIRTTPNTAENRSLLVNVAIKHAADQLQQVGQFNRQEIAAGCLSAAAELLIACHGHDSARRLLVHVADAVLDEQVGAAH
jgi:hypothetical protein